MKRDKTHYSQVKWELLHRLYTLKRRFVKERDLCIMAELPDGTVRRIESLQDYVSAEEENVTQKLEKGLLEVGDLYELLAAVHFFRGDYINYFVDEHLFHFLEETNVKDVSGFQKIIVERSTAVVDRKETGKINIFAGIIHSPALESSLAFFSFRNETATALLLQTHDRIAWGRVDEHTKGRGDWWKEYNVVMNLVMYMDCFPDCVHEGTPDDVSQTFTLQNESKDKRLSTDEAILDREKSERSPHFRRGYFKHLGSEFYKNKRGKTVFVRSTFVHGKAVVVEETSEKEEMVR